MAERRTELDRRFGSLWRGAILEPRGHDAMVGALLTPPVTRGAVAGVVFFDNVGPLWMCGHGTIGVVRTLEHLGRIADVVCQQAEQQMLRTHAGVAEPPGLRRRRRNHTLDVNRGEVGHASTVRQRDAPARPACRQTVMSAPATQDGPGASSASA